MGSRSPCSSQVRLNPFDILNHFSIDDNEFDFFRFTDTNADPHNSKRGFFFSHIGWLMCRKHPDVRTFGARVDMSDVENDPVLQFQRK